MDEGHGLARLSVVMKGAAFREGSAHTASNFRTLMAKYRNWADQLFPSLTFADFVDRVEQLGANRIVRNHMMHQRFAWEAEKEGLPVPRMEDVIPEALLRGPKRKGADAMDRDAEESFVALTSPGVQHDQPQSPAERPMRQPAQNSYAPENDDDLLDIDEDMLLREAQNEQRLLDTREETNRMQRARIAPANRSAALTRTAGVDPAKKDMLFSLPDDYTISGEEVCVVVCVLFIPPLTPSPSASQCVKSNALSSQDAPASDNDADLEHNHLVLDSRMDITGD